MNIAQKWPDLIVLVRHAETPLNRRRILAEQRGEIEFRLPSSDAELPLTRRGRSQAAALGRFLQKTFSGFDFCYVSLYRHAQETAEICLERLASKPPMMIDSRLRERDWGYHHGLTDKGFKITDPRGYRLRHLIDKYLFRPPGGESWADVELRTHMFFDTLIRRTHRRRVLIVTHGVNVLIFKKLLDRLSDRAILAIDAEGRVQNASASWFSFDPGKNKLVLGGWNLVPWKRG